MDSIKALWETRSEKYGDKLEGVLPKSFPKQVNLYLDSWMYSQIKKQINPQINLKILDIGCGYGRLSQKVLNDFPKTQLFGIDISQNYVDMYNKKLGPRGKAQVADMQNLPYSDNFFDLVFVVTALMYMTDKKKQNQAMKEIFRVLKPGGKFVFIERNTTGYNLVMLGGLVEKIRGHSNKEINAVSFGKNEMISLIKNAQGDTQFINGLPGWSLLLPLMIIFSKISNVLVKILLGKASFIDKYLHQILLPSFYLSYLGKKRG